MLFRRRAQKDFAAEVEAHIALEADRWRTEGMSWADAQSAARRAFGSPAGAQEQFYDQTHVLWLEHLRKDLLYAVRTLRGSPAFTATAVLTLALGIGVNTALFTVVDGVLLRPLPYAESSRIVMVYSLVDGQPDSLAPADFLDFQAQAHTLERAAAYRDEALNITGQDPPQRVIGAVVTPEFFAVMKGQAKLGRTFLTGRDQPGARRIVLSDFFWRRFCAGDPGILGKAVNIDGEPHTVIGVMPPEFRFPDQSQAWTLSRYSVPEHVLRPQQDQSSRRDAHYFDVIGRLAPGVSLEQARAETKGIVQRLKQQFGKDEEADSATLIPLQDDLVGETKTALLTLLGAATLLLLIACVNVANILLARGASRQKEIAIRGALGAGRGRIVRQLLTESLLMATAGGTLGGLLAYAALVPLRAWIPADMVAGAAIQLDLRVFAFTAGVALCSGLLFGVLPALQMTKPDLIAVLKEGSRGSTADRSSRRTRNGLVVSEIALATVLLIGASLLIRSFGRVLAAPEGFRPDRVLTMQTSLSAARNPTAANRTQFVNGSLDQIRTLPGVVSASVISRLPLSPGRSTRSVIVKGKPPFPGDGPDYLVVTPDYFAAMGVGLIRGRTFNQTDAATLILSASSAQRFFPNEDPIGQFIHFDDNEPWLQVIGIVADVRQHQLDQSSLPAVYVPYSHDAWPFMTFVVRMAPLQPESVQRAIHFVDKDQPVYNIRSMQEVVSGSLSSRRFGMVLLGLFAPLALVLACVGIYGVMAYSVAQRIGEIGIRIALGAEPRAVTALILRGGFRLAVIGVGLGLLLSVGLTRSLATALYGVRAIDGVTFAASSILLAGVAILASYLPAWRAAKVDPVIALRAE